MWRKAIDRAKRHPIAAVTVYVVLVSAFFLAFPSVDMWVSGLFYSDESGFWAQSEPFLRRLRHLGPYLVRIIAIASCAVLLLKILVPGRRPLVPLRAPLFLLTTLILGPGVLVNLILKNNWGRPRPVMVDLFGGDLPYQPVWWPTNLCDTNCSFVSGEASASIWLVAAVFLVPVAWRFAMLCFVLPLAFVLSVNRIAFGGHFLSDTMISWGLTLLVILVTHHLFYVRPPAFLGDRALDEAFTRKGRLLHVWVKKTGTRIRTSARRFLKMFHDHS
ncbi:phosphatase PAP2 family protein [uncultured Roseibium sp.]|uniref:phosphatase PAP2 family protein n=1 Tax=uncultured Roseibium sp. TaxID=1936171 RepID=UPI00374CD2F1